MKKAILCLVVLASGSVMAEDEFTSLDIQSLLNLEITSVAKKPQPISMAAAAVHVITADDIRRSTAQHVPDLLRTVPGLSVAQIAGGVWAVSARGMNARSSNKLLVLIDGRSVYSTLFSGVNWDAQTVPLAEIERIEVILGSGSAIWGANAVNGVINIVTKAALATPDGMAEVQAGKNGEQSVYVRRGGEWGEGGAWRLSAISRSHAPLTLASDGATAFDDLSYRRLSWRADKTVSASDVFSLAGEVYRGQRSESSINGSVLNLSDRLQPTTQAVSGAHGLVRWSHGLDTARSWTMQAYWDRAERDWASQQYESQDTLDLDFSVHDKRSAAHDLSWGINYRQVEHKLVDSQISNIGSSTRLARFTRNSIRQRHVGVFVQNDWRIPNSNMTLAMGAKLEKLDQHPMFFMPNVRLMWRPDSSTTVWSGWSRSVRVPSRLDTDGAKSQVLLSSGQFNGQNLPLPLMLDIDGKMLPEHLRSLELGYKRQLTHNTAFSGALYFNKYTELRSGRMASLYCQPLPDCASDPAKIQYFVMPLELGNGFQARTHGFEVTADWMLPNKHRVRANVSHFKMKAFERIPNSIIQDSPGSSPAWMANIQWGFQPSSRSRVELTLRYVDELKRLTFGSRLPRYSALDIHWSGGLGSRTNWFINARNIGVHKNQEFASDGGDIADTVIRPAVMGGIQWRF